MEEVISWMQDFSATANLRYFTHWITPECGVTIINGAYDAQYGLRNKWHRKNA